MNMEDVLRNLGMRATEVEEKGHRKEISKVFRNLRKNLGKKVSDAEYFNYGKDMHAFYHITNTDDVIHTVGKPDVSTDTEMVVFANLMSYDKMQTVKNSYGMASPNEHFAVKEYFPNFESSGAWMKYDAKDLRRRIAENYGPIKSKR